MILKWENDAYMGKSYLHGKAVVLEKTSGSSATFPSEDSKPTGFKPKLGLNNEKPSQIINLINLDGRKENYILIATQICKFKI